MLSKQSKLMVVLRLIKLGISDHMSFLIWDPLKSRFILIKSQERCHIKLENPFFMATQNNDVSLDLTLYKQINKDLMNGEIQMCEPIIYALMYQFSGGQCFKTHSVYVQFLMDPMQVSLVSETTFKSAGCENVVRMEDSPLYMECVEAYAVKEKVVQFLIVLSQRLWEIHA